MRKMFCILVLTVLLTVCLSAQAAPFDVSAIENSIYLTDGRITLSESGTSLLVYSGFEAADLAFTHSREADDFYSYADFDMVVRNYGTESEQPRLRFWLTLWTNDQSYEIESVTFTLRGQDYTFYGLSDEEDFGEEDGQYKQDMLIVFDEANYPFLYQLHQIRELGKASREWASYTIHTVFHGTEDITAELGEHLWPVFDVFWDLYLSSKASINSADIEGTYMEITTP